MEPTSNRTPEGLTQGSAPDLTPPIVEWFTSGFGVDLAATFEWFGFLWSIYAIIAYLFAGLCIYGFVYASIRRGQVAEAMKEGIELQEKLYQKHYGTEVRSDRWQEVLSHLDSTNPNDWRLSIIQADIMLDEALKQLGYAGNSLGERLRSITPSQLASIDDAWQAHKVRNEIAHAGADFVLTQRIARETVGRYQRVLDELGAL